MFLQVEPSSGVPLYRQIVDQVRLAVAGGRIGVDQRVPSVRELAEELQINLQTVAKAYAELVREGTLEVRRGLGTYVAKKSLKTAESNARDGIDDLARSVCRNARALGLGKKELQARIAELWDEES